MDKADKALASAGLLLTVDDGDGATNRAYYTMFDATTAALIWAGAGTAQPTPKTHGGLISAFGLHLVQTGHLPAELGRSLNRVHELRLTGDYLPEAVPLNRAKWAVDEATAFIAAVRALLALQKS